MGQRGKKIGKINPDSTSRVLRGYENVDGSSPNMIIEMVAKVNNISVATVRKILTLNGVDLYNRSFSKATRFRHNSKLTEDVIAFIKDQYGKSKGTNTRRCMQISAKLDGSVSPNTIYKYLYEQGLLEPNLAYKNRNSKQIEYVSEPIRDEIIELYKHSVEKTEAGKYKTLGDRFNISVWTVRRIVKSEYKSGYFNPRMEMF